jgi:ADP-ribose pyrophosphatase YjhB (NUDIX family)
MDIRVRAVPITDDNQLVVIRRERTGRPTYHVFPGGGVEPGDVSFEAALVREVAEEIAGVIEVGPCFHEASRVLGNGEDQRELFYLCRLRAYSANGGVGPEWRQNDPDNRYTVKALDLDDTTLRAANLLPSVVVELLCSVKDPFGLPAIEGCV